MNDCMQTGEAAPYVPDASATSTQQFDDRSRYASLVDSLILGQMMRIDIMLTVRLLAINHLLLIAKIATFSSLPRINMSSDSGSRMCSPFATLISTSDQT